MLLVSCGTDVKLHDCVSYDLVHLYRSNSSGSGLVRSVCWCKDGSWLALIPHCGCAEIIHTEDDIRPQQTILGIAQPIAAACQRTAARNIAMSTAAGTVLLYDIQVKGIIKQFVNSDSPVNMLDWAYKDSHLATGDANGQVTIYSNATNQKMFMFTNPDSKSVSAIRFHPTQSLILGTASEDGVVAVWNINSRKYEMCVKHKAPVTDLAFSSVNTKLMITVSLDGEFQCYDINAGTMVLPVTTGQPLSAIDLAVDGHTLAVASTRGNIYFYDLRKLDIPVKTISAHFGEIKKISFQPCVSKEDIEDKSELHSSVSSVDSFSNVINSSMKNDSIETDQNTTRTSQNDSFLNALEESNSESCEREKPKLANLKLCENVAKWLDSKRNSLENKSSTSGISSGSEKLPDLEASQQYKDTIVEELKKTINTSVKQIIGEQMSDLTDMLNHCFLNLQLNVSKQFVSYEGQMERLFSYYYGTPENPKLLTQIQQLQRENEFLRTQINELMQRNT